MVFAVRISQDTRRRDVGCKHWWTSGEWGDKRDRGVGGVLMLIARRCTFRQQ